MKTLVIHPDDESTDFLDAIYYGIDCFAIGSNTLTIEDVAEEIPEYDRIICLGHGSPYGLFDSRGGYLIDDTIVPLLKGKELICIWCNADQFMTRHGLSGFYSGMFISEVIEAEIYQVPCTDHDVKVSNMMFAALLGCNIDEPDKLEKIKTYYWSENNKVMMFNRARLYQN